MRILLAFIITVIIYVLLLWFYFTQMNKVNLKKKKDSVEHIIKIDLQEFHAPKKKVVVSKVSKVYKKNKNKKVVSKVKKIRHKKPSKAVKFKKRVKKKPSKKIAVKKNIPKERAEENQIIPESEIIFIENPLILNPKKIKNDKKKPGLSQVYPNAKIKELYGESFLNFSEKQKNFIRDNLDEIHRITQLTLSSRGYPSGALAAKTGQEGTNIVAFNLHPNGNISDLHLLHKVGYRILDENTLETIRTAYRDYPYPSEVTRIIFYVEYSIFGY